MTIIVLTLLLAVACVLVAIFAVHCVRLEERHAHDVERLEALKFYAAEGLRGAHFWQGQFRSSQEQMFHRPMPDEISPADYLVEQGDAYALAPAIVVEVVPAPVRRFCFGVAKRGVVVTRASTGGPGSGVTVEMLEVAYMSVMNQRWVELVCDADERQRQTPQTALALVLRDE